MLSDAYYEYLNCMGTPTKTCGHVIYVGRIKRKEDSIMSTVRRREQIKCALSVSILSILFWNFKGSPRSSILN